MSTTEPGAGGLSPGDEFAGHRIEGVIGTGGMGVVYRARHLALDRPRALKVLSPVLSGDERFRERFRRESRMAASLEHPNVVPVHEAGEREGRLYISMRLVEGNDLRELVRTGGALSLPETLRIVSGVAAGLDAAHAAGLVHRDVKPANVLVGSGADHGRVFLTDFGITRRMAADRTLTATGEIVGTADYLSPEQIAGDRVDSRADVYALGAVLYFALTGLSPFPRDNEVAVLFAHANAPRPRPTQTRPDLPARVDDVVAKAMAPVPADRFTSAGKLAAALAAAVPGEAATEPVHQPAAAATPRRDGPRYRRRFAWVVAAAALAAAIVTIVALSDGDGNGGSGSARIQTLEGATTVPMPGSPKGIAVGPDRAWVARLASGELGSIDARSGAVGDPLTIGSPTSATAVGFDRVWAVGPGRELIAAAPGTGSVARFEIGANPSDVAVDGRWVWVTVEDDGQLVRFDPTTNAVNARVSVGAGARSVAVGGGYVWVTNIEDGTLSKVDSRTATRAASSIEVGRRPADVAFGHGAVWVVNVDGGDLVKVEPGGDGAPALTGERLGGLELPRGVKAGLGAVWVVTGADSRLHRIDPSTLEPTARIRVGERPADVALGAGSVWTADETGGTVTRVPAGQP